MSRVLLIGGAGFIGAHLAHALIDDGHRVDVLDDDRDLLPGDEATQARRWRRAQLLPGATLHHGDAAQAGLLAAVVALTAPDAVVHLANLPLAGVASREPERAHAAIVGVTEVVAAAVVRCAPAATLTYVSSSMVYGDFSGDPQGEDGPLAPRNRYGCCKLEAEQVVRSSGLDWRIVRPSAVYGPGDGNGRFVARLVAAAASGRQLRLTADPATRLDFTWVGDLAAGLAAATLRPRARHCVFNVTAGRARSLNDAIEAVRGHGLEVDLCREPAAARDDEPRRGALDISRARAILGYAPAHDLADGLAEYLDRAGELVGVM